MNPQKQLSRKVKKVKVKAWAIIDSKRGSLIDCSITMDDYSLFRKKKDARNYYKNMKYTPKQAKVVPVEIIYKI